MNVEIIAFYQTKREDKKGLISGTMHIVLPDIGVEVRGICVIKSKNYWNIRLPHKQANDANGNGVSYPIFVLSDKMKQKLFFDSLNEKARSFIEEFLKENPESASPTLQSTAKLVNRPPIAQNEPKEGLADQKQEVLAKTSNLKGLLSVKDYAPKISTNKIHNNKKQEVRNGTR